MNIQQFLLVIAATVFAFSLQGSQHCAPDIKPRVMIGIVIDQLSAHYIAKLRPYLKGGIGMLAREGVDYVNAFYDHGLPVTGPGHFLLSTGTYGSVNGIINNSWFDQQGNAIACDDDTPRNAAVFKPDGTFYNYGKSARLCMVDTLSDQLIMHSYPHARNQVWSFSLKSRAAIGMAGRLGKAIWLDEDTYTFTSSKAYFKKMPRWLQQFNKQLQNKKEPEQWKLVYPASSPAYAFSDIHNYDYASVPFSIIGKPLSFKGKIERKIRDAMPSSNLNLLNVALTCFNKHYRSQPNQRMFLWLSLSSLDKVGHIFGPQSLEATDIIYHMDIQLKHFIEKIYERVPAQEVFFFLTADHGIQPLPELLQKRGFDLAQRYNAHELTATINKAIKKNWNIENCVQHFREPQLYLNNKALQAVPAAKKEKLYTAIKHHLLAFPGITHAWTFNELQNKTFASYDLNKYLQRQLYKGRSGQIIYATQPYTLVDTHLLGTSHITPFAYDRQVPLLLYQKGRFEKQRITNNVTIPQISVTLATLFEVPRPSAATASVLPGLKLL